MSQRILVIGGTGKTGRKIVDSLTRKGHDVRVGSRKGDPAFDWEDATTWERAFDGVQKAYITFQPDLAVPGALAAIEELVKTAKKAKVEKLVLLSGKGEREAELCEQTIINSGLQYTIVRASWFNQNFSESFFLDPILSGHVALPQATVGIPFVDTDDIADVAVEALLDNKHNGQIYQLTGPSLLTFKQAVAEISKASGRNISFTPITISAYTGMMEAQGVPKDFVWLVGYLFTEVLGGAFISEITNDIELVLGRKPKDFATYAKETAATGVWAGEHITSL
mgnify:CR=1 FL=1